RYIMRILDNGHTGARHAHVRKISRIGSGSAQLPEEIPDRPPGSVQRPFPGDSQAIAVLRIDQARIEFFFEMSFDPCTLDRKVAHVRRAFQYRVLLQMKIDLRLEEQGSAHKNTLQANLRSATPGGRMV